jgi:hypothetical protein
MSATKTMQPEAQARSLELCRLVEHNCLSMLDAARHDDWDRVARLQSANEAMIADARVEGSSRLSPDQRCEQLSIMRRIIILDGEIRRLREPWQRGIEHLLTGSSRPLAARMHARS